MTQIKLVEALSISSNYLSRVERGCKSLSLDKLLELVAVLEINDSQIKLVEALSISSNYLSRVERGCKSLSLDKLLELVAVLEINDCSLTDDL